MTTTTRGVPARRWLALAGFLLLAFAAGGIGAAVQGDDVGVRYLALDRPGWAPPAQAFGLVWPVLYLLIGIAGWRVWDVAGGWRAATIPLALWSGQLALNALWPGVFFGAEAFGPAIGVIVVLVVQVGATVVAFARRDRLAAALLLPYLAWLLYATALNVAIWSLNAA